jgi:undecaprenyl-diphosphatase
MLTYIQAIILGGLQGITELFPISSLGHSVILPTLLGWQIDQHSNFFLIFLVATHLATALVLLGFFFSDWVLIVKGIGRSLKSRTITTEDTYAKLGWLIVVSSIPVGILGLLFQEKLKTLFASPSTVALFLLLNGFVLYGAELLRRKSISRSATTIDIQLSLLSWAQSAKIGIAQCLALIPGFSRTGTTLGGGLLVGLSHEAAARFSFLLATPIIFAAAVLKLPELLTASDVTVIGPILVGSCTSAGTAYFSIRFLTKYFETKTLTPFALYCVVAGSLAFVLLNR